MTMKVYCEHGALSRKLRALKSRGIVQLVHFPYDSDSRSRHLAATAAPSEAQWRDMNVTWGEATFAWDECGGSQHFAAIRQIIGPEHRRDVLHVDSAFKSGCACFVTVDQDILAKRRKLESLLGIRFFHPEQDEAQLVKFLEGGKGGA